ncbi:class I SAM-dependent methyltransferase [Dyella sp. 2HG41-7]|uniref:class I SAM-dependent methyltransferase n=1 Tax=Dyella sp. 2HG41-7 TaxID=2883239 RepID=UPI001F218436|nr:class I SAM-dependent methyltransferase [Dyella sp. 2HG41-7]
MTTSLQNTVDALLQDRSLREPDQLARRIDALDRLEAWLVYDESSLESSLCQRANAVMAEWEAINEQLFQSIRDDIRQGSGAKSLCDWAEALRQQDRAERYDPLDALVAGVLNFEAPGDVSELANEMVFYQPTPARHIFDFIARAQLDERDVVMDLGSGLGHVALLTAICTPARCIGIELEHAYVVSARQCAQALNIGRASFIAQDVRATDLSEGSVFYLYTPFTGTLLRSVLDDLRRQAERRTIRLWTLGPCTTVIANEPWLVTEDHGDTHRVSVFQSR